MKLKEICRSFGGFGCLETKALIFAAFILCTTPAYAQQLQGAEDPSRIDDLVRENTRPVLNVVPRQSLSNQEQAITALAGTEKVQLQLDQIILQGNTVFDEVALKPFYEEFLGKNITLDKLWVIAARISSHYQSKGYFLSRAYVPEQEIKGNVVSIAIAEGHVSEIEIDEASRNNKQVFTWTSRLLDKKPLNITDLESLLLRLNDLPGRNFRTVLELPQTPGAPEGASRLNLITVPEGTFARTSLNNHGSVYLGPWQASQELTLSLIENQQTQLVVFSTLQLGELLYGSISHMIPLTEHISIEAGYSQTHAEPGDDLKVRDINNISRNYRLGLTYLPIRQRDEMLTFRLGLQAREVRSRIFDTLPLTEDSIRTLQGNMTYQFSSSGGAVNLVSTTVTQGLNIFNSTQKNDLLASRAGAAPDFTKFELQLTRVQPLPGNFAVVASMAGQYSPQPLLSSEEFGYGGQSFGRAYDTSELTGDSGVAAALDLRYNGLPQTGPLQFVPYVFYDRGFVWNENSGSERSATGSSAGLGVSFFVDNALNGDVNVAFPLLREVGAPINGQEQGPRINFSMSYTF